MFLPGGLAARPRRAGVPDGSPGGALAVVGGTHRVRDGAGHSARGPRLALAPASLRRVAPALRRPAHRRGRRTHLRANPWSPRIAAGAGHGRPLHRAVRDPGRRAAPTCTERSVERARRSSGSGHPARTRSPSCRRRQRGAAALVALWQTGSVWSGSSRPDCRPVAGSVTRHVAESRRDAGGARSARRAAALSPTTSDRDAPGSACRRRRAARSALADVAPVRCLVRRDPLRRLHREGHRALRLRADSGRHHNGSSPRRSGSRWPTGRRVTARPGYREHRDHLHDGGTA